MTSNALVLVSLFATVYGLGGGFAIGVIVCEAHQRKSKRMSFKIELGSKVRDRVTGYEGTVIGRTEWLYGCRCYTVQTNTLHEGRPIDSVGFDEERLELLNQATPHVMSETGGPAPAVPASRPAVHR